MIYTTQSVVVAQELLGKDFIHPADLRHSFKKIPYTTDQVLGFLTSIPSEEILVWGRDNNCMLVPGPAKQLSLLGVRNLKRGNFRDQFGGSRFQQDFAVKETVGPSWILMRKQLRPDSILRSKYKQLSCMPDEERLPTAVEAVWCLSVFWATRGVRLLPNNQTYVSSENTAIGLFSKSGILVSMIGNAVQDPRVGAATVRKLD